MDHDRWWAYNYPKSLGLHDQPKLGVAATVKRLEVAADPTGAVYFHNVRVNGVLPHPDGPSLPTLTAVLNSRAVDFAFRRGAARLQNGFYTANKQFIAWLPIPTELPGELEEIGSLLYEIAAKAERERSGFLAWLSSVSGIRANELNGARTLADYPAAGLDGVLAILDKNARRLAIDTRDRTQRDRITRELSMSVEKLAGLDTERARLEGDVDLVVYDAYKLTVKQQARVASEFELTPSAHVSP
jgi:hypothetical protein